MPKPSIAAVGGDDHDEEGLVPVGMGDPPEVGGAHGGPLLEVAGEDLGQRGRDMSGDADLHLLAGAQHVGVEADLGAGQQRGHLVGQVDLAVGRIGVEDEAGALGHLEQGAAGQAEVLRVGLRAHRHGVAQGVLRGEERGDRSLGVVEEEDVGLGAGGGGAVDRRRIDRAEHEDVAVEQGAGERRPLGGIVGRRHQEPLEVVGRPVIAQAPDGRAALVSCGGGACVGAVGRPAHGFVSSFRAGGA
ncbi:MAG: hypothetical protein R2711_10910 [Acidimicrobiales bacterium]